MKRFDYKSEKFELVHTGNVAYKKGRFLYNTCVESAGSLTNYEKTPRLRSEQAVPWLSQNAVYL